MVCRFQNFLTGVLSKTGALASHISRVAKALDSLIGARFLAGWDLAGVLDSLGSTCRTGSLDWNLGASWSPDGEGTRGTSSFGDLALESKKEGILLVVAAPIVPETELHIEEAFVLVVLNDEVSDAGDEWPEDGVESIEGLDGRTDDSEIQWCSYATLSLLFQSLLVVNCGIGARLARGLETMVNAAGSRLLVR